MSRPRTRVTRTMLNHSTRQPPSDTERAAFIDAIAPHLFGERYLFAWNAPRQQYFLVMTTEPFVPGATFAAHVLPFN